MFIPNIKVFKRQMKISPRKLSQLLWALCGAVVSSVNANGIDFSSFGTVGLDYRWYAEQSHDPRQRSHLLSLTSETTFFLVDGQDRSFTFTPYFRYDATDPERSLVDVREAYFLTYGDIGDSEWELRLGIDKVFWGVAELFNLVNIIGQTDLVDDPDQKSRLGQPMARLALTGERGTFELLGLPYHRKRTYPGQDGRLRGLVVDTGWATYEDSHEEQHLDLAARFLGYAGPLDIGFSVFRGTSRDPTLRPDRRQGVLLPHYELIRQYGLEAQLTTGPWILKLEAIHRSGLMNLHLQEEDYSARLVGGEYTLYGVFDSDKDVGLIVEWISDDRDEKSTTAFQNDLFMAVRVSFNDVEGTEVVTGLTYDLDNNSRVVDARIERRLSDSWSFRANAQIFWNAENDVYVNPIGQDDNIGLFLEYHF